MHVSIFLTCNISDDYLPADKRKRSRSCHEMFGRMWDDIDTQIQVSLQSLVAFPLSSVGS